MWRRRKGKRNVKAIEIPPYFPPSRYQTTKEEPIIDHENHKIVSLPSILTRDMKNSIFINHVGPRSVKDELVKEAENALLGEEPQTLNDSSGVHPGILYGGPAGGILAPIGVWFFKLFKKRRKKKKQRKTKLLENSDEEDSDEEDIQQKNSKTIITSAVTNRITNAGNSVLSHIKGKITDTGSVLINDFKAQAIAQEEEILENIRTTVLEQEQAMMNSIKQKITNTQKNLVDDLINKLPMFEWSQTESVNEINESCTLEKPKKEEETLSKLSDSEMELTNTVKRRISNAQDALIPEIEKSIESTHQTIIENIENRIPEARGPHWSKIKSGIRERGISLLNEIKAILTCTEKNIIDDVKSQISETKSVDVSSVIIGGASNTDDKVGDTNIQPGREEKPSALRKTRKIIVFADENGEMTNKRGMEIKKESTSNTIISKIFPTRFFEHSPETRTEYIKTKIENDGLVKANENRQGEIESGNPKRSDKIEVSYTKSSCAISNSISNMNRMISGEESNILKKIKNKVALPLNLLKHTTKVTDDVVQTGTLKEASSTNHAVNENDNNDEKDNVETIIGNQNAKDIIQPQWSQRRAIDTPLTVEEKDISTHVTHCNEFGERNDHGIMSSIVSTTLETIIHGLPSQLLKHDSDIPSDVQTDIIKTTTIKDNNLCSKFNVGNASNINNGKEFIVDNLNKEIVDSRTTEQETGTFIRSIADDEPEIESKQEVVSSADMTIFDKIKHNVSIPLQFLNFYPNQMTQMELVKCEKLEKQNVNSEEYDNTNPLICNDPSQRTDPIPIPVHQKKLGRSPLTQKLETRTELCDNSSSSSLDSEHEKNNSFFDSIKNSVPYLPFSMNFSGIPDTVKSYLDPKHHDATNDKDISSCLSEVKVFSDNMASSRHLANESQVEISEQEIEQNDSRKTEFVRHVRFSTDSQSSEERPSRKWIVLDFTDEEWPSHLPKHIKNKGSSETQNPDQNTKMLKWLQPIEEDMAASWPNHLPKNLHIETTAPNKTSNQTQEKRERKQMRIKKTQFLQDDSESPEEEKQEWRRCLPKNILLKPIGNENDRKESIVSTNSEFSTTSSIDSTSSGTLESRDSCSGYKLPNFESKLEKKKSRNRRLKSLDSGIHHYYGEYRVIEFPPPDSYDLEQSTTSTETSKTIDKNEEIIHEEVEGSSHRSEEESFENSQEEDKSVQLKEHKKASHNSLE